MGIVIPKTDRVVVRQADFAAYLALLRGSGDNPGSRIAYDGELLEIMSPSKDHERYKILFDQLIGLLAIEWGLIVEPTGSMTLTVEPRGAEPDSSYYVDNDEFKTNSLQLDLAREPAPDLVVEIDLSRERLDKRSIYASIGVTEFWRYDGKELRAFYLTNGRYEAIVARDCQFRP